MYTALIFSARNDLSTVGKHFVIGVWHFQCTKASRVSHFKFTAVCFAFMFMSV